MKSTSGLAILGCIFFLVKNNAPEQTDAAKTRPNIIVFLVDDMGWQDTWVPFHSEKTPSNSRHHTPNMERLAKKGMKFTNAYATPVCTPHKCEPADGHECGSLQRYQLEEHCPR